MSHTAALFIQLGGILLGLSLLSRLANRLGQSAISFYMTAGLFLGTGGLIPISESYDFLAVGSEIGVVLLLLLIGLEYSPKELVKNLKSNRNIGLLDAALNAIPGAIFGYLLGWGLIGALVLAGVTWVSSSGVIVRLLTDMKRMSNRETPTIISVLVLEDLAMAFYLPVLSAIAVGETLLQGSITVAIAIGLVVAIVMITYYQGRKLARIFSADHSESLLIGVAGLAILIAGFASEVHVSTAVGAFLVGIALSGKVAAKAQEVLTPVRDFFAAIFFVFFGIQTDITNIPQVFIPAAALAAITMSTKVLTGYLAAKRAGIAIPGRWRSGFALTPRGEFSIIIAGLAVTAGVDNQILAFAATYMLITVIAGPVLARFAGNGKFISATKPSAYK